MEQIEAVKVAIVGGGIAGATTALYLSELGINVCLLEKGPSLVNGPPICHLHAGGNLYPDISDKQCLTLLEESIDLLRLYPYAADYRPTVIALPKTEKGSVEQLLPRLNKLQNHYQKLINKDPLNKVLGDCKLYFKLFDREKVDQLAKLNTFKSPKTLDQWMIPVAQNLDLDKLQFPLIMVQEYGLNLFRLAAIVSLSLESNHHCLLKTDSEVKNICSDKNGWLINYQQQDQSRVLQCDYLINAAGFRTGQIDDLLGFKKQRLVEFKAAYVTKWKLCDALWPEVIFHGKRGTPNGMAQFTPYPDGYFQLHGMTRQVTLFKEGLVASSSETAQPQLPSSFTDKIDKNWSESEIKQRTCAAINHLARFIPSFADAEMASKPLFGAQQIPGSDASLRASDVSFVGDTYARCEIVKASSILSASDEILKKLQATGLVNVLLADSRAFKLTEKIRLDQIKERSVKLAVERDYPASLADVNTAY